MIFTIDAFIYRFITHRKDANKKADEENAVPWGSKPKATNAPPVGNRPLTPTEIENMVSKAEKEALVSVNQI